MRLLLDTHIFLWLIGNDKRLSAYLRDIITDPHNEVYLSVVSVWEAIIKHQLGKLQISGDPTVFMPEQREQHAITSLFVDEACVVRLAGLPPLHRDPFDRLIICQALQHDLTLVTADDILRSYPVRTA